MPTCLSKHYEAVETGKPFKPNWLCLYCDHVMMSDSNRRKLEHLLKIGTTVKGCPHSTRVLNEEDLLELKEEHALMEANLASSRRKRENKRKAVETLTVPERPRARQAALSFAIQNKDRLDMEYARMLFMSAAKTGFMDSEYVSKFFGTQFQYTPPSRKVIMGPLLDHLFKDTQQKVEAACNFKDLDSLCTLTMDAWQSPTNAHIRNYMLVFDHVTFFCTAKYGGSARATAQNIADEAIEVIADVGDTNIAAVATDNASAETTSWDLIREVYNYILCTGCTAHGASLLFKTVCNHTWAKNLIEKATKLAKFMKNHSYTQAELKRRTADNSETGTSLSIILHGETRFAAVYYTLKRLGELRGILREIVVSDGFGERNFDDAATITAICNDGGFWTNIEKLRLYLKPLKCLIKLFDHDTHTTEHVFPGMLEVLEKWQDNEADVPSAFKNHCLREHRPRNEWMLFDIHMTAYALSPKYHDHGVFNNNSVMSGLKKILRFFCPNTAAYTLALTEFAEFKNTPAALFDGVDSISSKAWWQLHGAQWPNLQPVAVRVFCIGTTSCPSERNFSTWSHIWSMKANRLKFETANKLVYIYFNLRALQRLAEGTSRPDTVSADWLGDHIDE